MQNRQDADQIAFFPATSSFGASVVLLPPSQQRLLPSQCVSQGCCVLRSNERNQPDATFSMI